MTDAVGTDAATTTSRGLRGGGSSSVGAHVVLGHCDIQMRPIGLLDEKGKMEVLPVAKARYGGPRISPDGSRLAVAIRDGAASHIWIYQMGSQQFSRFAFPNGNSARPTAERV